MSHFKYVAIRNQQRSDQNAPVFLLFRAKAAEISAWAAIERHTADSQKGPQRLPKPAKVSEVKRFFERDARNTIPTALLVSLNVASDKIKPVGGDPDVVSVEFDTDDAAGAEKPGIIVDGQHRLLGAMEFKPEVHLNVVAMVNITSDETAFQFLVVNNKASRVSSNHLRAVVSKYKEDELNKRLMQVRMSISQHLDFVGLVDTEPNSPFKGKIEWSNNPVGQGFIAPNAIESSIAYLKQKRVPELDQDDAILLGFFLSIWTTIETKWKDQFSAKGHLLEKVPIICLTQFLADNVIFEYDKGLIDVTDFVKVQESVSKVLDAISPKFWEAKWVNKSLDTATGRNLFLESLTQIRRNMNAGRSWYDNVPIVDLQGDLL